MKVSAPIDSVLKPMRVNTPACMSEQLFAFMDLRLRVGASIAAFRNVLSMVRVGASVPSMFRKGLFGVG